MGEEAWTPVVGLKSLQGLDLRRAAWRTHREDRGKVLEVEITHRGLCGGTSNKAAGEVVKNMGGHPGVYSVPEFGGRGWVSGSQRKRS